MENKPISQNVIQRLPKYYRYLKELCNNCVLRVSSKTISNALHITASQVRQDLSHFGGFGQTGIGYDTEYLKNRMQEILGLNKPHGAIVIGGGNIGQALISYKGFKDENVFISAVFDIETSHLQALNGVEVLHVTELENYLSAHPTDIAIICVQKEHAENMAKRCIKNGVKSIWNFAPIDLYFGEDIAVENINMSESLMRLIYNTHKPKN